MSGRNVMRALCIIPARGGSRRIPRKNIRPLRGRPLLGWVIETAQAAGVFCEIMVSTDDAEIAGIAREYGAAVPFPRSLATATDRATTTEVLIEVLANYESAGHGSFALVCCLYPTAALLQPEQLRLGFEKLNHEVALDSVMAVQAYRHPIERAYREHDGLVRQTDPALHDVRTQDLVPAFHDAGQFYWFRPERLATTGEILGERCAPIVLAQWEAVDLDNEADWALLERLAPERGLAEAGGRS
jgi:N-acylneuraminate cytidylyltransferase